MMDCWLVASSFYRYGSEVEELISHLCCWLEAKEHLFGDRPHTKHKNIILTYSTYRYICMSVIAGKQRHILLTMSNYFKVNGVISLKLTSHWHLVVYTSENLLQSSKWLRTSNTEILCRNVKHKQLHYNFHLGLLSALHHRYYDGKIMWEDFLCFSGHTVLCNQKKKNLELSSCHLRLKIVLDKSCWVSTVIQWGSRSQTRIRWYLKAFYD